MLVCQRLHYHAVRSHVAMVLTELVPVSEVLGVVEGVEDFEGVGGADRC